VQVEVGSGAEQGGLFIGDTVLKLNGQPVPDVDSLRQHLRGQQAGNTLDLQILRGGELRDLQVTLGTQK
jgi:putative serine protease PepD